MPNVNQIAEIQLAYSIAALNQILKNLKGLISDDSELTPNGQAAYIMKSLRELDTGFDIWSALLKIDSYYHFHSRDEIIGAKLRLNIDGIDQLIQQVDTYVEDLEERFTWNGKDGYAIRFHPNRCVWEVFCCTDAEEVDWTFELSTM